MATENTGYAREGKLAEWLSEAHRIHMIGIGGAGMRVLARLLADKGYAVTGSDSASLEGAMALSLAGIPVTPPDASGPIIDADLAVYSTAVPKDHPEMRAAEARSIPLVSRADLFGGLMGSYCECIGIAGTHGKSTTAAMCGAILEADGRRPTLAVGAPLHGQLDGYKKGGGGALVFEACEYGDAFLAFSPTVAVLTNAEWDHPDYFPSRAAAVASFARYLSLPSVRVAVINRDDEGAREAAAELCVPTVTFGFSEGAELRATELAVSEKSTEFTLTERGECLGRVTLRVRGRHNVENALAAAATARAVGVSRQAVLSALSAFPGIGRRLEYRGTLRGVAYYDDYAHHPTEIRASLSALSARGRLFCVYQPHTYTRTGALFSELTHAFGAAYRTVVVDTYAAREDADRGPSAKALAAAIGPSALYLETPELAALWLREHVREGDTVVVMGAGDVGERFFVGEHAFSET